MARRATLASRPARARPLLPMHVRLAVVWLVCWLVTKTASALRRHHREGPLSDWRQWPDGHRHPADHSPSIAIAVTGLSTISVSPVAWQRWAAERSHGRRFSTRDSLLLATKEARQTASLVTLLKVDRLGILTVTAGRGSCGRRHPPALLCHPDRVAAHQRLSLAHSAQAVVSSTALAWAGRSAGVRFR